MLLDPHGLVGVSGAAENERRRLAALPPLTRQRQAIRAQFPFPDAARCGHTDPHRLTIDRDLADIGEALCACAAVQPLPRVRAVARGRDEEEYRRWWRSTAPQFATASRRLCGERSLPPALERERALCNDDAC